MSCVDYIKHLNDEVESEGEGDRESEFEYLFDAFESGYFEFKEEVGVFTSCLLHFNFKNLDHKNVLNGLR